MYANQISSNLSDNWVTVCGIRSTGLSAAPAIGEYVTELYSALLSQSKSVQHVCDTIISITDAENNPIRVSNTVKRSPPLPSLDDLSQQYKERNDGKVVIHGMEHRVTHLIASFGMEDTIM